MRAVSFVALIVGVILIPTALGVAKIDHDRHVSEIERSLVAKTDQPAGALASGTADRCSCTISQPPSACFW